MEKHEKRNVVALADARAHRTVAEATELASEIARGLQALPPDRRRIMRARTALALHDLEALIASLEAELEALANDLHSLNQHSGAATAYGRIAHVSSNRMS